MNLVKLNMLVLSKLSAVTLKFEIDFWVQLVNKGLIGVT